LFYYRKVAKRPNVLRIVCKQLADLVAFLKRSSKYPQKIPVVSTHSTTDASPNKSSLSTAVTATDAPPKASSYPTAYARRVLQPLHHLCPSLRVYLLELVHAYRR
jgi:hypothetical protein